MNFVETNSVLNKKKQVYHSRAINKENNNPKIIKNKNRIILISTQVRNADK